MKKYLIILFMALSTITTNMFGQVSNWDDLDINSEERISAIRKVWANNPLQVTNEFPKAHIRDLAKAFCSQYQDYQPNAAMFDYLKKPGDYTWEEKHYYVEDDPRHGFIKCDMGGQFDYMVEMCYWRRPDGHQLVGVLMQVGHEGEKCDGELLFYDFDPKTNVMTPDMDIYQTTKAILRGHPGSNFCGLPQEGKDISITSVYWSEMDDFVYYNYLLKWMDNTFIEEEDK